MLSVVGGRRTSALQPKKTVYYLLKPVVEAGYVIVSGCAKGIDTYSHQAAISWWTDNRDSLNRDMASLSC